MAGRQRLGNGFLGGFGKLKADYQAAATSRFRRTRTGLGGTGDAHYTEQKLWQIREYARDFVRNDAILGQAVRRLVENIIGTGMMVEPMTGDAALDDDLKSRFSVWANDPLQCDATGRMTFHDMEQTILEARFIDGDVFVLPARDDPWIQIIEADRCISPRQKNGRNIVHGIELSAVGRPMAYFFREITQKEWTQHTQATRSNVVEYAAFDDAMGMPLVWHVKQQQRVSQTRGIPCFAPIFDESSMLNDVNFAKLVQQQVVSCMALIIERTSDMQLSPDSEVVESNTDIIEELSPGTIIKGLVGENVHGFSPDVPNETYLDHVKFLLRLIGANLGLPLELMVFDVGDTTFHGHRANMVQARKGFQCHQKRYPAQFHRHVWQWKLRQWMAEDSSLVNALASLGPVSFFRHTWHAPVWEYVDPLRDSQGDKVALESNLTSPRRQRAARGLEWSEIAAETVEDWALLVRAAIVEAQRISQETGVDVDWHDLISGGPVKRRQGR